MKKQIEMQANFKTPPDTTLLIRVLGLKRYELSNHLGNVVAVVSDRKKRSAALVDGFFTADLMSYSDYYPFGMQMPGRVFNSGDHIYGFGGHLKDDEIKGIGNQMDFGGYGLDVRLGRRPNVDPEIAKFPWASSYAVFNNNPMFFVDPTGREAEPPDGYIDLEGNYRWFESEKEDLIVRDSELFIKVTDDKRMFDFLSTRKDKFVSTEENLGSIEKYDPNTFGKIDLILT